jgi:hypothetical protein
MIFKKQVKNLKQTDVVELSLPEYFFLAFGSMIVHFSRDDLKVGNHEIFLLIVLI